MRPGLTHSAVVLGFAIAIAGCGKSDSLGESPAHGGGGGASGSGGAGDSGGAGGAGTGGGVVADAGRARFWVLEPVPAHALRAGENPADFSHGTHIVNVSTDGSVVMGASALEPLNDGGGQHGQAAFRWTEASGVLPLGAIPGLDTSDPRTVWSFPLFMSPDGSAAIGQWGREALSNAFRWTQASGMTDLGAPPDSLYVNLAKPSSDCAVVGGTIRTADGLHDVVVRWTKESGWVRLAPLAGHTDTAGGSVSADGSVMIGTSLGASQGEPVRWTGAAGVEGLGVLPGASYCHIRVATADTKVMAGECEGSVRQSFRWTATTGMVPLAALAGYRDNRLSGMSADGAIVVGESADENGNPQAFRWTAGAETVGLGFPPGFDGSAFGTFGMSADGTAIIGVATRAGTGSQAFLWHEGAGIVALAPLPGDNITRASAICADGTIVVGYSSSLPTTGATSPVSTAVRWDARGTVHVIADDLAAAGADLQGVRLTDVSFVVVSDDVMLYGRGEGSDGPRGWVARLPAAIAR
jgi:probable HAF family extracellular repeat protein